MFDNYIDVPFSYRLLFLGAEICLRRDHIERSVSEVDSIISYLLRCTFFTIFIAIAYYRSIVAVGEFVIILVTSWDLVYNDVIGTTFAPLIKVVRT